MNRLFSFLFIALFFLNCSASPETAATDNTTETPKATAILTSNPNTQDTRTKATATVAEEEVIQLNKTAIAPTKEAVVIREKVTLKAPIVSKVTRVEETKVAPTAPSSRPVETVAEVIEVINTQPDHLIFDEMLQAYVNSSGVVNYRGWKSDLPKLDQYLAVLSQNEPDNSWSRSEKMAYWINLYNASTIKLILDNSPLKSIMDINGGKPWDKKWIKVGIHTYSLNEVENDIIRPRFGDGRIHFAINCAAKSCPPIHNRAFTASNLNSTMARLTRKFVNNTSFNQISSNKLELSSIFDWYGSDFGDLKEFLGQYTDVEINADATISFKDYDWALNGR